MGVVNVTPDSFSDGGHYASPEKAYEKARALVEDGADIIDIGAESTRPGSAFISLDEEWRRLEPLLDLLKARPLKALISIDTNKPEIMRRAVSDYRVSIINDVRGGADEATLRWLSERDLTYVAMHMHETPETMQANPLNARDALARVFSFYEKTEARLRKCGFSGERIWLDPGIGFGKTDSANLQLLRQAMNLADRFQLVIGVSRKGFIGRMVDIEEPALRDAPTKMLEFGLLAAQVACIRTHDVKRLAKIKALLNGP